MSKAPKKILIIDDEPEIRSILRDIAEPTGLTVTEAENGQDALDKIKSENFDLILSDVKMPKKDGISLLKEFRTFDQNTPFYILTAFHDTTEHQIYLLKGNGVFYKPINFDALTQFFESHL